jgi:predicted sugar kinase
METGENTGETAEITLKTKLIQLGRARDKSDSVLKGDIEHIIRRHIETLKESLTEVSKWHRTVEAEKITSKEEVSEIDQYMEQRNRKACRRSRPNNRASRTVVKRYTSQT